MIIILLTRKITRLQIENKNRTPKNKEWWRYPEDDKL